MHLEQQSKSQKQKEEQDLQRKNSQVGKVFNFTFFVIFALLTLIC